MTDPQTDGPEERAEGLTRNCIDSIRHALDHFSANYGDEYGFHNQKWAILSVAHAAEAFCNLLLFTIDHNHPNGRKYPDLRRAINALKASQSPALTRSELHAIKHIFPGIEKQRDELMHRIPPQQLDAEHAALVLLALVYLVRRRVGERADDPLDGDTHSVFDELGVRGKDGRIDRSAQQRWFALAAMLAFEDYGPRHLEHCSQCECLGRGTVPGCRPVAASGDPGMETARIRYGGNHVAASDVQRYRIEAFVHVDCRNVNSDGHRGRCAIGRFTVHGPIVAPQGTRPEVPEDRSCGSLPLAGADEYERQALVETQHSPITAQCGQELACAFHAS